MFPFTGVLLVLVSIYFLVAQAKVSPDITARDEDSSCSKRTLFNIVWGCVSTTIICAWAALHPNIAPREGPLKRTLRRVELMFWTIVAPEILPCWALNQLLAAITVKDVYNEGKGYETKRCGIWETVKGWVSLYETKESASPAWTVAHGHFLVMGGFHLVEPPEVPDGGVPEANTDTQEVLLVEGNNLKDTEKRHGPSEKKPEGRVTILTLEMLRKLVKDSDFEIQKTENEITDRSKGDALSKLIFILQSTWFILQCIGRRVQGLDLTHLELTTLALASLNGITFLLWWDKPLGAQAIVRVHLKRKLADSERQPEEDDNSSRSEMIPWVQNTFGACVSTIRDAFRCQPTGLILLPLVIILLPLFPVITLTFLFFTTVIDLTRGHSPFSPDDMHVPTFYVPKHRYSRWYHILLLVILGVVFGGIHCSGWNFSFPTHTEQSLWRLTSLAVTTIPFASFCFAVVVGYLPTAVRSSTINEGGRIWDPAFCFSAYYVAARLTLLGLALAHLRQLPPTAYIAIDWTKFFPHFL